jgi:hypothetical protein
MQLHSQQFLALQLSPPGEKKKNGESKAIFKNPTEASKRKGKQIKQER